MFGKRIHLFKLFGFPIRVDLSWFIIVVLVTWSLAEGLFMHEQWFGPLRDRPGLRWVMGAIGALGLFVSIVLHELGHAKVAQRHGLPVKGITLFIFGGVAEMSDEPPSAKVEFFVAVAGPIVSIVIGAVCGGLARVGEVMNWPLPLIGVLGYLGMINIILVLFNLIPAFPLDGGRVLRSAIWHFQGSLEKATQITSQIGSGFGLALMILAVFSLLAGNVIGAVWWFLIGMFLRSAAQMSYQRLILRQQLEGETVERFMHHGADTVSPHDTIRQLVDQHIYQTHHKMYPVVEDGRLIGCVTVDKVKSIDTERWDEMHISDLVEYCGDENTIDASADATEALGQLSSTGRSRLMVTRDGKLAGVISLKDLMNFLTLKIELEGESAPRLHPTTDRTIADEPAPLPSH